ncbi:hypothetical protein [Aeromonas salmonicida]|uniref:hypothetical protein n=1 Tax=Aeromonas salmonicida TaxID=645 RepID=UPI00223ECB6E|nr:hypothetical protein [Aeromonas salmonicida]
MKDCNNKKNTILATAALIVILLIVFYPYIYTFEKYGFSDKHQAWANFGGYVGGILGPVFSALAFFGIWKTYNLQKEQLKQAGDQRKSEDIQRLIMSSSERMDELLNAPVDALKLMDGVNERGTMYNLDAMLPFLVKLHAGHHQKYQKRKSEIFEEVSINLTRLTEEAANLSWLLEKKEAVFNEKTTTEFFHYRYKGILENLKELEQPLHDITKKIFELDKTT